MVGATWVDGFCILGSGGSLVVAGVGTGVGAGVGVGVRTGGRGLITVWM